MNEVPWSIFDYTDSMSCSYNCYAHCAVMYRNRIGFPMMLTLIGQAMLSLVTSFIIDRK